MGTHFPRTNDFLTEPGNGFVKLASLPF